MKPLSEASRAPLEAETNQEAPSPAQGNPAPPDWTGRWPGGLVLWAGWLIPQLVLLGPALVGQTVDLPVDLLATNHLYLPNSPEYANVRPRHGDDLFDLLLIGSATVGNFSAKEIRAGRLPLWQPANFGGAPIAPLFSPFAIPYYIAPSPITLAWIALLQAATVGLGMWLLLRQSFRLSYWPAAIASWCAPLTGFMTVWHGFSVIGPFCWLPWLLWAAGAAVKNPRGFGSVGVALLTALVLLSGHPGIGGLVLLTTGLYVLWLLADEIRLQRRWPNAARSAATVCVAWALGFLIAAPYLLPLFEFGRSGIRIDERSEGMEERPPAGLGALVPIVLPDAYSGDVRADWHRINRINLLESSSGAYAGLLAVLWLAPLAWCDRKRRSAVLFFTLLIVVSLGWTLDVPGIVDVLRSAPLRWLTSLSYNRWVFATAIGVLILSAMGLESLRDRATRFRRWFLVPMLATACLGGWCLYNRLSLREFDEPLFSRAYDVGAGLSLVALAAWATMIRPFPGANWVRLAAIGLIPFELLWFAWNERRQADIALYFPRIPVLEKLAALPSGRIWGIGCFPPNLNLTHGLEDVRGYDAVDPRNSVKLLELAVDPKRSVALAHARTQLATPLIWPTAAGPRLHPVADLLNVRYLIFRERPPAWLPVILHEDDYWIAENRHALPRACVPRQVHVVKDDHRALSAMAGFDFDPRQAVFMTDELGLPDDMQGQASVRYESPTKAELDVEMQTAGLVLLADSWNAGWRAELDGHSCPIYRVDVALRGFHVPAGKHRIVCTYDPPSVRIGIQAAAAGGIALFLWTLWKVRAARQTPIVTTAVASQALA
jgi:hypothetical protein